MILDNVESLTEGQIVQYIGNTCGLFGQFMQVKSINKEKNQCHIVKGDHYLTKCDAKNILTLNDGVISHDLAWVDSYASSTMGLKTLAYSKQAKIWPRFDWLELNQRDFGLLQSIHNAIIHDTTTIISFDSETGVVEFASTGES